MYLQLPRYDRDGFKLEFHEMRFVTWMENRNPTT